eukprot:m.233450 g.233450  ORF g.233450 m.233450 type:complete len:170 (-) comp19146_c0_seq1:23-532(-)
MASLASRLLLRSASNAAASWRAFSTKGPVPPPAFDPTSPVMRTRTEWTGGLTFTGVDGNGKKVDLSVNGEGVSPMQVVLIGLAGCAAVDVVTIFEKQRKTLSGLVVHVDGQRAKEGARPLQTIHLTFKGKGSFTQKELEFAVQLASEKYCGVYATLEPTVALSWQALVE